MDATAFCKACESGDITTAKGMLRHVDASSLEQWRTSEDRTCLHVAVLAGDPDLLRKLGEMLVAAKSTDLIKKTDNQGDTALHLAVRKYRMDLVEQLANLKADLCDCENKKRETPLQMAVRLGFVEAVELLITRTSNSLQQIQKAFLFHLVVGRNQVKLVNFLKERKLDLSKLINQPYRSATNLSDNEGKHSTNPQHPKEEGPTNASGDGGDKACFCFCNKNKPDEERPQVEGDTPLHIAARNKYDEMVDLLVRVDGVNKNACNSDGKTPLDIAREVTEYNESWGIIMKLTDYPPKCRPFMYCAPQLSREKQMRATRIVNEAFGVRRDAELVMATLLATMTFTAAFSVPGGFQSEATQTKELGSPILITSISFKLFLIFDSVAFILSFLACIRGLISSELSTGHKMFMTGNSLLLCCSFGFTVFAFMAALYSMLAHKVKTFAWVILGNLVLITLCGVVAFIGQTVKFLVDRARFHRLYCVHRLFDDIVEELWNVSERRGSLHVFPCAVELFFALVAGDTGLFNIFRCNGGGSGGQNDNGHGAEGRNEGQNEDEDEHSNNGSCSSSPWLLNRSSV